MMKNVVCLLAFCFFACTFSARAQMPGMGRPQKSVPDTGLHAILLGTGIPIPNPDRAGAATLIVADGRTFLVDTGHNSLLRLTQNGFMQVDTILYTHFHIDHYADLGRFLFTRGVDNAQEPQKIMGPVGTRDGVDKVVASVAVDEGYRIAHHGEHWPAQSMHAEVEEFEPGVIFEQEGLTITMFKVNHEPVEPAVGYRFDYKGKSIVVSGDTKKSESLIEAAQDCDLLIHEAMNADLLNRVKPMIMRTNPRQAAMLGDLMEHHTSTREVAEIAVATNAKRVVLTHLVPSIAPSESPEAMFVRGMDEIYSGPIVVGRDNMIFTVE